MAIEIENLSGHERESHRSRRAEVSTRRRSGAGSSFEAFFEEFRPRVAGYVRRHIHDYELIDDIVQETLLRAYGHGLHEESSGEQWRWLSTVARNLCIDQRALHRNWRERTLDEDPVLDVTTSESVDPEVHAVAVDGWDRVSQALAQLNSRERRLLVQKHLEGRGVREMAQIEGIHVEALKSALRRARRAFHESYTSVTGGDVFPSVLGPIVAAASLRVRSIRARIGARVDQVTTLAAHTTTSPGFAHTMTAAAVIAGLTLGPGLGTLLEGNTWFGRGGPDGSLPSGELVLGKGGSTTAPALTASTRSVDSPLGQSAGRAAWTRAGNGSGGPSGGDSGGGETPRPSDPPQDDPGPGIPGGTNLPTSAPDPDTEPDPVDVGPDSADEPEDAHIIDLAYSSGSSPGAGTAGSSSDEGEEDGAGASDADGSDADGSDADGSDADGSDADGSDGEDGSREEVEPTVEAVPEIFALGIPRGAAASGCHTEAQCSDALPTQATPCQIQCSVLFHSTDGGESWEKLPAKGLEAYELLLPSSYPEDPRIFAAGRLGLMVSNDGGHTFSVVIGLPTEKQWNGRRAALWPGFGSAGEDRIVLVGDQGAWVYRAGATTLTRLRTEASSVHGITFGRDADARTGVLIATTSQTRSRDHALWFCTMSACETRLRASGAGWPSVEVPTGGAGNVDQVVEVRMGPEMYRSEDYGRTFSVVESVRGGTTTISPDGNRYRMIREDTYNRDTARWRSESVVLVSTDHGQSFTEVARSFNTSVNRPIVLPDGRFIASGFLQYRNPDSSQPRWETVMCSVDGGATWDSRCGAATV